MYKALEVREYDKLDNSNIISSGIVGELNASSTHYYVVICEDIESKGRCRFEFNKRYIGDFDKLIAGDVFTITDASGAYAKITIIEPES